MSDNWEGDRDLDEYKGQDWRGSVFDGKHGHDGKYRGVTNYGGGGRSGGSSYGGYGGGKHYGSSYSGSNSNKKFLIIPAIIIPALIFGFLFFFTDFEFNLPENDVSENVKKLEEVFPIPETSPLLDILNSQDEMTLSNCVVRSDTKEKVTVYCGDFGSANFVSELPIKSTINPYSEISQKNGGYRVLILGNSGQMHSYILYPQNSFDVTNEIESISKEFADFDFDTDFIPSVSIPEIDWETVNKITSPIESEVKDIIETTKTVTAPVSPIDSSKNAIDYINQIRVEKGRNSITFDERAYDLALARVRDTLEYNYFDHTNPFTGSCPDNMKTSYGFSSNEYVAENLSGGTYGSIPAIDLWMTSQGHRYNILFTDHKAGAVACEGGNCVFLGVNSNGFGQGCHTGAEGEAWHDSLGTCSDSDFAKLDSLHQQYDTLVKEYDKYPEMSRSQAEYQQAMKLYNQLQSLYSQIENFKC